MNLETKGKVVELDYETAMVALYTQYRHELGGPLSFAEFLAVASDYILRHQTI